MVIDVVYIHVMFITCNNHQQTIKLFFLYRLVIPVNSQSEIRPIINIMSSIRGHTRAH